MKDKENKSVYRFPPCSFFDVEGIESWLSDMALEGCILEKDGMKSLRAEFKKGEPADVRYRLVVAGNGIRSVSDNEGKPTVDERLYYKKYGWEYVASYRGFNIYRTSDPEAPELHTEPEVQALTFRRLRRQYLGLVIYRTVLMLLPIPLILLNMVSAMLRMGSWLVILWFACAVWGTFDSVRDAVILIRVQKKLKEGISLDRNRDWRKNGRKHAVKEISQIVVAMVLLAGVIFYYAAGKPDRNMVPITEFEGEIPFAVIADFAPDGRYTNENWGNSNEFKKWRDLIAPVCIVWDEGAHVYFDDGGEFGCHLHTEYYEMSSSWLARALAREKKLLNLQGYEFIDIEVPGADYAFIYYDYGLNIVIQDGNRVVHARVSNLGVFMQEYYDIDLTDEEYIRIVAEEFLN